MRGLRFFEPDTKMIQWFRDYIGERVPIDVGCGEGDLLIELKKGGVGIDPLSDVCLDKRMELLMRHKIHFLEQRIEDSGSLIGGLGNRAIMIFARPCHSDFVVKGINLAPNGMEVLYITKPENIEEYNDLGRYDSMKRLIKHKGRGNDNEVVYSIMK